MQNPNCAGSRITSVQMLIGESKSTSSSAEVNQDGRVDMIDVQLGVNVYLGRETES